MKKIALITNFNIADKVNAAIAVTEKLREYAAIAHRHVPDTRLRGVD